MLFYTAQTFDETAAERPLSNLTTLLELDGLLIGMEYWLPKEVMREGSPCRKVKSFDRLDRRSPLAPPLSISGRKLEHEERCSCDLILDLFIFITPTGLQELIYHLAYLPFLSCSSLCYRLSLPHSCLAALERLKLQDPTMAVSPSSVLAKAQRLSKDIASACQAIEQQSVRLQQSTSSTKRRSQGESPYTTGHATNNVRSLDPQRSLCAEHRDTSVQWCDGVQRACPTVNQKKYPSLTFWESHIAWLESTD